ncbi:MAG: hypothetical protein M3T49_01700 [Candidatus Eremiobacteraeota bacterium]|nr:hypothetical protein [Candidatus Eremiobacteraeota bacterium]
MIVNENVDSLTITAREQRKKVGLRKALASYDQAAEALAAQGRPADAAALLADVLRAREKRSLLKRPQDVAQWPERLPLIGRYAALMALGSPGPDDVELLEQLCAEHPDDGPLRRILGESLDRAGRHAEAVNEFQECLRLMPTDGPLLERAAASFVSLGRPDLALDRLRRALESHLEQRNVESAIRACQRINDIVPDSLEDALHLSELVRGRSADALLGVLKRLATIYHERLKLDQEVGVRREIASLDYGDEINNAALAAVLTRILDVDPLDRQAWERIEAADPALAGQLHVLLCEVDDVESQAAAPTQRPAAAPAIEAIQGEAAVCQTPGEAGAPQPAAPHTGPPSSASSADSYVRTKAYELLASGDLLNASLCFERLRGRGAACDDLRALARCYAGIGRADDALRVCIAAAGAAEAAGDTDAASAVFRWLDALVAPRSALDCLRELGDSSDDVYMNLRGRLGPPARDSAVSGIE